MPASPASTGFRLPLMSPCLCLDDGAEIREQDVADRTIHGLRHQQRQQRAGGADHHTGDHQRRVLQHKPLEADREARERIVDRDHDRHVGAADRQRHQDAKHQCGSQRRVDQLGRGDRRGDAPCASRPRCIRRRQCGQHDQGIEGLLPLDTQRLLDDARRAWPRRSASPTATRRRSARRATSQRAGCAVGLVAEQLDRGDRAGRAAAHAVIERDHLRHRGHRDLAARSTTRPRRRAQGRRPPARY